MFGIRAVGISRLTSIAEAVVTYTKGLILSLKGDSAYNKNQNSTILDRSVNSSAITRGGDAAQTVSSFSPFSNTWSYYFDGSGDYMTVAGAQSFNFGTGDFTIEAWVYLTKTPSSTWQEIISLTPGNFVIYANSNTGALSLYSMPTVVSAYNIPLNRWVHIAVARQSGTIRAYADGIQVISTASTVDMQSTTAYIGALYTGNEYWTGYISNLRIVKGTAVYTAAFTPPTTALTAVANTSLLTCHSGRMFDASSNAFDITVAGNTSASTFSPFNKVELTGSVDRTSVWFSGSSNTRLSVPNSNTTDFGTGDFTIECWVYGSAGMGGVARTIFSVQSSNNFALTLNSSGSLLFGLSGATVNTSSTVLPVNAWAHIAVARSGTTCRMFINGVQVSSATNSTSVAATANPVVIGNSSSGSGFVGYISDARIVKGTALYTAAFTPPTGQLTAVSGTTLLTCQGNTLLSDSSSKNATVTAATVSGSPALSSRNPFGSGSGWSGYFDGTGDYLTIARNAAFFPAANTDFTIEAWVYLTATPGATNAQIIGTGEYGTDADWVLSISSGLVAQIYVQSTNVVYTGGTITLNTWNHIAVSRSGTAASNFKLFVNGVGTSYSVNNTLAGVGSRALSIGADQNGDESNLTGYISNARMVNGTAVYTGNFTPPTAALTAVSGTSLLTLQDNTFKDNSSNAFAVTRAGDTAIRAVGPFGAGDIWSGYFDGTGDKLTVADDAAFQLGTGNFTIEFWVNFSSLDDGDMLLSKGGMMWGSRGPFEIYLSGMSNQIMFYSSSDGNDFAVAFAAAISSTLVLNRWYHFAVVRSGTTFKTYQNGSNISTWSSSASLNPAVGQPVTIGSSSYEASVKAYMSNVRIVKGTAVYTSDFVPSPTPLTAVSGTSLLTLQDRIFKDNSGNAFAITVTGNTSTVAEGPFAATFPAATAVFPGSIYFDGTNDYLTVPASAAMNVLGGDLTIECWFNPTSLNASGYNYLIMQDDGGSDSQNFQLTCSAAGLAGFTTWNTSARASAFGLTSTRAVKLGAWNHIAVTHVKSTNTTRLFLNGVLEATSTTAMWAGSTQPTCIGNWNNGLGIQNSTYSKLNGYLSGVRLIKGEAIYTAAFTPPTAPPTVTAGTALLLNFNDGGIVDTYGSSSAGVLSTVGNVSTNSVTKKYGTGSLYFDGTGDYLTMTGQPEYAFGTGDFTIECWVNATNFSNTMCLYDSRPAADGAYITLYVEAPAGTVGLWVNGVGRIMTAAIPANTWVHVALVRASGTTRIYINGAQSGSSYTDSTSYLNPVSRPVIGGGGTLGTQQFIGYMDNLRVYRGYAKYTSSFTPSEN